MKILILQITLLLEVAKYMLSLQLGFKAKFHRWKLIPVGMVLYLACICLNEFSIPIEYILMYLTAYSLVILMNTAKVWKRIVHFFFIFLIIAALDEVTTLGARLLIGKYSGIGLLTYAEYFISNASSFFIVIFVFLIAKIRIMKKSEKIINYIKDRMYLWITLLLLQVLLMTAILNYVKKYVESNNFKIYVTLLSIFTYFGTLIVSLFLVLIRNSNMKLVEIVTTEREFSALQANYYEMLLEREEETRKYRHDTMNHLICINTLIEDKNLEAVSDYIGNMYNQLLKIKNKGYDVGNEIINIFINNYLTSLEKNIDVIIIGKCVKEIDLSDIDICIIFSNLIQNAVEEINKRKQDKRFIKINFHSGMEYLEIKISNSMDMRDKKKLMYGRKKFDRKNHGHGLNNVINTLSRNNSELFIDIRENIFEVTFVLKYKIDRSRS